VDHSPRRTLAALLLALIPVGAATAQVVVSVSAGSFKPEDRIEAKVINKDRLPVSYCIELGQWSPHAGTVESTPVPFYVERKNHDNWNVLLIGPDIGSSRQPATLSPGTSSEFSFRLHDIGEIRLVLHYWIGERDNVCKGSTKGSKTAKSKLFSILKD